MLPQMRRMSSESDGGEGGRGGRGRGRGRGRGGAAVERRESQSVDEVSAGHGD